MKEDGFSIITVTNRNYCIENIINNYYTQSFKNKEHIIIINNDNMTPQDFSNYISTNSKITIYKLSEKISLGECLNFGVNKSNYNLISKFDDDDYYGQYYLNEAYRSFLLHSCYIVGKNKTYYYLEESSKLILKNEGIQNGYTSSIMGSTICFDKEIFHKVKFRDISVKEDFHFNNDCIKNGYKIYATSSFNHIVFKHFDNNKHTFLYNMKILVSKCNDIKLNTTLEDCINIINSDIINPQYSTD